MKTPYPANITVMATSQQEALTKINALQQLANNITAENLKVLAEKSGKAGVNEKIQKFKSFI